MALLLMEGFDQMNGAADLGAVFQAGNILSIGSASSRWGSGKYMILGNGGSNLGFQLANGSANVFVGFAFQPAVETGWACSTTFYDNTGVAQVTIALNVAGSFSVRLGAINGTVIATSGVVVSSITNWNYYEFGVVIGTGTTGSVIARVNGATVYTLSGINTKNSTTTGNVSSVGFSQTGYNASYKFDDVYICDNTGAAPNNTFLGDVRVQTLFPTANDAVAFTPLAGTNWASVSETAMDSDTSYNVSATVGAQDSFLHGALLTTPTTIFAAQVSSAARRDDAGPRTMKNVLLSGTATGSGATVVMSPSYTYQRDIFPTDPNTGLAWTAPAINASRHGYNLVS